MTLSRPQHPPLLDVVLDSWDRNNAILLNLLRALPHDGLDARAVAGSPCVSEMFTHINFVRLVLLSEDTPEFARPLPEREWMVEQDRDRIAEMLNDSAAAVRQAVERRAASGLEMDTHYDHPLLLIQHLLWHEGYHHGQIKLALRVAGLPISNDIAGPLTWRLWMAKNQWSRKHPSS